LTNYIVASSKTWHTEGFQRFLKNMPGTWYYVSNKKELTDIHYRLSPRYIFFLHWNWIVPETILELTECICFHMTDVPYGRGGSPLQNLILRGHKDTVLTAMRMIQEIDAGPVYCKTELKLHGTAQEIYARAGDKCWDIIRWIVEQEPIPLPQVGEATIFRRRSPEQSELPKAISLEKVYDFIRMLDAPTYPKAFVKYGDYLFELSDAELCGDEVKAKLTIRLQPDHEREE
jgi:methionyl-tRNA formyltransferase